MEFQTLNLQNDESNCQSETRVGFWSRQFQIEPTQAQRKFDWAYGVVVPLVCVAADPIVFRDQGLLEEYRPFAYLLSSISIMAMAAWLLWGKRLGWLAAPLGGLFIAGGLVSFVVGAILFPISFIGLVVLIGFLGFTPIFSGLVFLRNGSRAIYAAQDCMEDRLVWQSAALAALFALVIPFVINARYW
jgi:hypothetical protein